MSESFTTEKGCEPKHVILILGSSTRNSRTTVKKLYDKLKKSEPDSVIAMTAAMASAYKMTPDVTPIHKGNLPLVYPMGFRVDVYVLPNFGESTRAEIYVAHRRGFTVHYS